ncbi:hypothetical protein DIS24_g4013 [Lasiodiplodia hormozganensis]|uniref:Uncharacterized protein n=1 Tax=Lasiodiplodia hormozganensis TaxID=869390 RepID=A0AA39YV83_9PEZI|nr:hypothetical protein DIS24_g4013 [Lasiodiplodia hormozganensis]
MPAPLPLGEPVIVEVECVQTPPEDIDPGQTVTTTVVSGTEDDKGPVRLPIEVDGELVMGLAVPVPDGVTGEDDGPGPGPEEPVGEVGTGVEEPDDGNTVGLAGPLVGGAALVEQGTVRVTVAGPPLDPHEAQAVTVVVKPGGTDPVLVDGRVLPV